VYLQEDEINIIIDTLKSNIPKLKAIYIFGSFASKSATNNSDVDIVYLSDESLSNVERWEISAELARFLRRDVDLVDLRGANTIFRYQIISTAKRVYSSCYEIESFEKVALLFFNSNKSYKITPLKECV